MTQSSSDPAVSGRPAKLFQARKHAYQNVQGLMITSGALESITKEPLEGSVYLAGFKNTAIHEHSNHQITGSPKSAIVTPATELIETTEERDFEDPSSKSESINDDVRSSPSPKATNLTEPLAEQSMEELIVRGESIHRLEIRQSFRTCYPTKKTILLEKLLLANQGLNKSNVCGDLGSGSAWARDLSEKQQIHNAHIQYPILKPRQNELIESAMDVCREISMGV
jgi:hypothetical protein